MLDGELTEEDTQRDPRAPGEVLIILLELKDLAWRAEGHL